MRLVIRIHDAPGQVAQGHLHFSLTIVSLVCAGFTSHRLPRALPYELPHSLALHARVPVPRACALISRDLRVYV